MRHQTLSTAITKVQMSDMDDRNHNWLKLLKHWAQICPDKVVFKEPGKEGLTYGSFYRQVCSVADTLLTFFGGQMPEAPIAVAVERDVNSLVSMFGVCAAGGWYVPMDSALPTERAELLLSVCSPAALLYAAESAPYPQSNVPKLFADVTKECCEKEFPFREETLPLFGIFTSGSTGIPKLVVKDGRGIRKFIENYCSKFGLTAEEVFGNQIPFYFDASTKDIFATVMLGATGIILPQKAVFIPMHLIQMMNDEKITTFVCVPSVMSVAARFEVFSALMPTTLRNVLFVGERMPVRHLNYWRGALPSVQFVNLYGSTEVAGNSCFYIVDREFGEEEVLPIGHTFDTAQVFLLDENNLPAKEGEICVAGEGLALGYYRDEDKTNAAFRNVTLPTFSGRVYHSGDYGRINEYGEYICIARKDAQIKHMGHRIELGDIEVCASALEYVDECCCLFAPEAEKIILFCACKEHDRKRLRKDLSVKLPKYMLPHEYVCFPELRHNRNGKIDRAGLLQDWIKEHTV